MTWLLLCVLGVAVLVGARRRSHERLSLHAHSSWALDELCRSIGTTLHESPDLRELHIVLSGIAALDRSSIASLKYALARLHKAQVQVSLEGCSTALAHWLLAHGIAPQHIGALRPQAEAAQTALS
jgi:hypothetical protein